MSIRLCVALSAGLAAATLAQTPPTAQEPQRPEVSVQAPASASGRVRVIVGLRTPFVPEGALGVQQATAQRAAVQQAQSAVTSRLQGFSATSIHAFETIPFMAMDVDAMALSALSTMPEVQSIAEDRRDRLFLSESTAVVQAPAAWSRGLTGDGWAVAILDTGVDKTHPMLTGKVVAEACYSAEGRCPGGATQSIDSGSGAPCTFNTGDCGHGTHVAGIAAGKDTSVPRSGVAPDASIIAMQIFSGSAYGLYAYESDQIKGLERVLALRNAGMAIASVNMSLGGGGYPYACDASNPARKAAIDNLRSVGIATVIASGNDGYASSISQPACISTAVSVGSTTKQDAVSDFSNSATMLKLLAPGAGITSAVPGGSVAPMSGTSMATPHVAGAWAVLKQAMPAASVPVVLSALSTSGQPITDSRNGLARPRINVNAAIDALDASPRAAALTSPAPGATLATTTVTFTWEEGVDATEYYLYVGTTPGGYDVYDAAQGTRLEATVTGIPLTSPIYVRLYSRLGGAYRYRDYIFATPGPTPATITSPSPGSTLTSDGVTFTWSAGAGVSEYFLYVGTSFEGYDLYQGSQGTNRSRHVAGLPVDSRAVYVTLWSRINGAYQKRHYTYTAVDGRAELSQPSPGAVLWGSTERFFWTGGAGVSEYHLYIGSTPGGYDLYDGSQGLGRGREISGLPIDGRTLYIRLWSKIGGVFRMRDYTVQAATRAPEAAEIWAPAPGAAMYPSATGHFSWTSGQGVSEYYLYVGTQPGGYDLYEGSQGRNLSRSVPGLPDDGRPIYATLWSRINGAYQTRSYSYTGPDARAAVYVPTPGSELPGSTVTFQWTPGISVTEYYLYVGSSRGAFDIYEGSQGSQQVRTVSGIPTDGRAIWVRIWSRVNGTFRMRDYSFTAAR
jgi:subtilisin family serine protease